MARGNRNSARGRRRISRPRRRFTRPKSLSVVRNGRRGGVLIKGQRDLVLYSRNVNGDKPKTTSWLDHLWAIGTIALRQFLHVLAKSEEIEIPLSDGSTRKLKANSAYCTGVSQSVLIGAEDLLRSNAIVGTVTKLASSVEHLVPCINYRQALVRNITVQVTSGSHLSDRAGRYSAVLLPLTEEELDHYSPKLENGPWQTGDSWSFSQISQMPGSVTAPFGVPLVLHWRASAVSFAQRSTRIGQYSVDGADFTKNLVGANPICRLIVAYQDFSTSDGSVSSTYGPSECTIQIQIRGNVILNEPGLMYIRSQPVFTEDSTTAAVATSETAGRHVYELPVDNIIHHSGRMYVASSDFELMKSCKSLALEQMSIE